MGVLDKLRAYRLQAEAIRQPAMEPTDQELSPISQPSPVGETTQQARSYLQSKIIGILEEHKVPMQAVRFIPGFGDQVHKLLYGNPYECHTFFADMHWMFGQLLDQDAEFDPVVLTRKQAYAEAEERAAARRANDSAARGSLYDPGTNWFGEKHASGSAFETIPAPIPDDKSVNYRLEAAIQGPMVDGRPDSEAPLQELE
jgi:hypothetical protein